MPAISRLCLGRLLPALALLLAGPAAAQPSADSAQIPIPRGGLLDPEAAEALSATATESVETSAVVFDPSLAAIGRLTAGSGGHMKARTPIPVDIIRNGFASRDDVGMADRDRSIGFRLGRDVLSLSTTLTSPATPGASRDASLGWRLAQPVAAGSGLIWGMSTSGTTAVGASPEQAGDALIGYRQEVLPHLTLTSQLGVNGNYVFAPGDGLHSALTPEVKLTVDLAKAADLPWQASLDLGLARKLPLVASDYETSGTAMLSMKYKLQ